jgi:hypothetical protein
MVLRRDRAAVSSAHVKTLNIKRGDKIHTADGSPEAIPLDRDLI